jgi:hypothetical protein
MITSKLLIEAIAKLKNVKSVNEWNNVRAQYRDRLTRAELFEIDGCGLIVQVLGRDK